MRYNIHGRLIYDATDGTLTLPGSDEADSQLSITANALLWFFLRHTDVVSRDEVLKKVWDDNGLTSSNSNLNQYLSMLRKTFRHYDIDNIIVTVSRGLLQLNPDLTIEMLDAIPEPAPPQPAIDPEPAQTTAPPEQKPVSTRRARGTCWYLAGGCLLTIALLLVVCSFLGTSKSRPIMLTQMSHSQCELLASDEMLRSVAGTAYGKNFDAVRQRLKLECKPGERFVFFYGDRLETNGLGRVFLAHCAMHEDNPFSYCDNYFYYSWKPQ
ncbi:winged helix-turn-helix domain-containing protein [Klebsiella sp. RHBSTW-00215]|uniref:winged helix-turn-helix domain-containing protein n=1 Tax=Klebsiella sp. RHBSTW-00215 TaxID=2742640 RepID=UPI0015F6FA66|nr:winged helix-turn-helix domain-containing protein [Klebsiella sp. RHBSTW-00215]MBA7931768.1 winged helix-turn-helix domain-containing protein [Klebsiella sp. RHBSTW-00215]